MSEDQNSMNSASLAKQKKGATTRKKTIDFAKLGQKMTLSDYSCHRCKTMIPVNEENFCKGPIVDPSTKKTYPIKKKLEPCQKRFCNECLQKYHKESWIHKQKNSEIWVCPFCLDNCSCSQCTRKRAKEGQIKNQFLAQFDQPEKVNKRQEKQLEKQKSIQKPIVKIKKGKSQIQNSTTKQQEGIKYAITEDDWQAYQESKANFYKCLNKYDWSNDIPALEQLKMRQHLKDNEEEKNDN